ncbi:hypothetical protein BD408DRAFT_413641 [Parasitella parasitica]|nr:hypothetical protein BD408DRAFT_413641 [Parasitella parasitica]
MSSDLLLAGFCCEEFMLIGLYTALIEFKTGFLSKMMFLALSVAFMWSWITRRDWD